MGKVGGRLRAKDFHAVAMGLLTLPFLSTLMNALEQECHKRSVDAAYPEAFGC
jgi:hypothetical protein